MKAFATALVLIVGAAVVLWFGNTLNSWVLGGLIGGLAALLISIPISLTLFSYLAKRHEQSLVEEIQEPVSLSQMYEYPPTHQEVLPESYEVEGSLYALDQEAWDERATAPSRRETLRPLPDPRRVPTDTKSQSLKKLPAARQSTASRKASPDIPSTQSMKSRRTTRRLPASNNFSEHRSQALRTARLEARQGYDDDIPTRSTRQSPPSRSGQVPNVSRRPPVEKRLSRQLTPPNIYPRQPRQRSETPLPLENKHQSAPLVDKSTSGLSHKRQRSQSDYLPENSPRTEPVERSLPTGQIRRMARLYEEEFEDEASTGSLQKPLVRRAPYLYEDDPLRQEYSQYADHPVMRRSSRYNEPPQDDLEEE